MGDVIPFPGGRGGSDEAASDADLGHQLAWQLIEDAGGPAAAWAAMQGMFPGGMSGFGSLRPPRPTPQLLQRRPDKVAYVVRVDLDDAKPPIWRRLRLASDVKLAELHGILQTAMGWTDSHLHSFKMGPDAKDFQMVPFLTRYDIEEEGESEGVPEADVRLDEVLAEPGHRLFYEYDFGDGWHHTIKLEKVEPWVADAPAALCVAGRRACPPEDVGGLYIYAEVLDALAGHVNPGDEEWAAEKLGWLPDGFDPAAFDVEEVNEALAQPPASTLGDWRPEITKLLTRSFDVDGGLAKLIKAALLEPPTELTADEAARATERYRTLVDIVGDSVKLTAAGYLPPRLVEAVYAECRLGTGWIGRGNREDQTYPVLTLRESATALGLLRKAKGTLSVTAAGGKLASDPVRLLAHIAARLPFGRDHDQDAGLLCLLFAAAGRDWYEVRREAASIFASLGWRSENLEAAVYDAGRDTDQVLDHLVGSRPDPAWSRTVARGLLARRD
jgi:Plasmid pRiA4b ORF-3-like protein